MQLFNLYLLTRVGTDFPVCPQKIEVYFLISFNTSLKSLSVFCELEINVPNP